MSYLQTFGPKTFIILLFVINDMFLAEEESSRSPVSFEDNGNNVVLKNGFLSVRITKPGGIVTSINYGGINNILTQSSRPSGGYWDLNWSLPNQHDNFDVIKGTKFSVIKRSEDVVELSFYRAYNSSQNMVPLNIDKRFVMLRGSSGFYTYGIYDRDYGWPDFNLNQARIAFKLREDYFDFMAIGDTKQRVMPYPEDRAAGETLAYPEAVLLTHPKNPELKDEVDDKYQYSCENRMNRLHGWISSKPRVGFWIITASDEFRNGGPTKQDLTSHVGPTCLSMFHSAHYGGQDLCAQFRNEEAWKKVFGPVFVYLNSASSNSSYMYLWNDAKRQLSLETKAWPYSWPESKDFIRKEQRGSIQGTLIVQDSFISTKPYPASFAFLGLALPGETGSWQTECKGYQFWTQADAYGRFRVSNVVPGTYDLFGWVPGVIGDYKVNNSVIVTQGASLVVGTLVYKPPRTGPTLWEIGTPERTAAGFYVPEATLVNKLFLHQETFRQYGLWSRYSDIYPEHDLVFEIGTSDWRRDWFFIHVCRVKSDGQLAATTWEIHFELEEVSGGNVYTLRIALACSTYAALRINVNSVKEPVFDEHIPGRDNAIARHAIHGLYSLHSVEIQGKLLAEGKNILYITQRNVGVFSGVMYDYVRLEGPM